MAKKCSEIIDWILQCNINIKYHIDIHAMIRIILIVIGHVKQ